MRTETTGTAISLTKSQLLEESPFENAVLREVQILGHGLLSSRTALSRALQPEERRETFKTLALSAATTFAISCLKRSPALGPTVSRILLPALTISSAAEFAGHGIEIGSALADNWNSTKNWKQNRKIIDEQIGSFGAQLAISLIGSSIGELYGRNYFAFKTPGTAKLPELNNENLSKNWQRHLNGELVPYKFYSAQGGGMRRVDLFIPPGYKMLSTRSDAERSLLIAPDGLELSLGPLRPFRQTMHAENGLADIKRDPSIDYVAAFPHPKQFRVLPGVNLGTWFHEGGLISAGGLFTPKIDFTDTAFLANLESRLSNLLATKRTTLAGFSSGGLLANELAARLGPEKIQSVVSVASTVTGKELPATRDQFRLYVRDSGDPTLLQEGGPGGKARLLAILGHRSIMDSAPRKQIEYGLQPYASETVTQFSNTQAAFSQSYFYSAAKKPLLAYIETSTNSHAWPEQVLKGKISNPLLDGSRAAVSDFDLNKIVKEITKGDLKSFDAAHFDNTP